MKNLPKVAIVGASGRMGQMLIKASLASDKVKLVGVTERNSHEWIGRDLGVCMGTSDIRNFQRCRCCNRFYYT